MRHGLAGCCTDLLLDAEDIPKHIRVEGYSVEGQLQEHEDSICRMLHASQDFNFSTCMSPDYRACICCMLSHLIVASANGEGLSSDINSLV